MADGVFNIAKGRVNQYQSNVANNAPANSALIVVLLQTAETDATLEDYDDLAALLAAANTEADFTNYIRKVLTDADLVDPTPDDTNNWQASDMPDQTWTLAGGATNNDLVKWLVCYDPDSTAGIDSEIIPLTFQDFVATTDGNDLIGQINSNGYHRAA